MIDAPCTEPTSDAAKFSFFFVHVMKTGGTTLRFHARRNFRPHEIFPIRTVDTDMMRASMDLGYFRAQPRARLDRIRYFQGHFPYFITKEIDRSLVSMTILRDPIDRAISLLADSRAWNDQLATKSIEELYDDPVHRALFVQNYQVRMFALLPSDGVADHTHPLEIDERRFAVAVDHLDEIQILGLHDEYHAFLEQLSEEYGWLIGHVAPQRVGQPVPVPSSLRRRIAADNTADVAFFEHARDVYERRRRKGRRTIRILRETLSLPSKGGRRG